MPQGDLEIQEPHYMGGPILLRNHTMIYDGGRNSGADTLNSGGIYPRGTFEITVFSRTISLIMAGYNHYAWCGERGLSNHGHSQS